MADDRYDWLDEEAAERLLRGEPAGSPDGAAAAELTALLNAAAEAGRDTAGDAPLPGEESAVAAFRQAYGHAPAGSTAAPATEAVRAPRGAGAATRRRFGRPLRRGFMVALAGCALGGVAVAAGAGVLPTPFRSTTGPAPATSVSAAESPGQPATDDTGTATDGATPMPDPTPGTDRPDPLVTDTGDDGGTDGTRTPDPGRSAPGQDATGDDDSRPGTPKDKPDAKEKHRLGVTFCHTYESGRRSVLGQDTLRRLERAAGGPDKVHAFCRQYLAHTQDGTRDDSRYDGDGRGNHGQGDHGHGGKGGHGNKGGDEDGGHRYAPSAGSAAHTAPDPAGIVTTTPAAPDALRIPGAPPVARV
ncbi:hypothetical protein [Streptomyces sp. NPDC018045]|uniref:hypothetical protein n=1 Tax=Streptomyces sp. NPDC018045 TaxID=3365037 RepID=UPI0037B558E1